MRFNLTTLRLFVTAVQDGSIMAAASRHNTAPSAVSRRLSDMEHHLGAPVLYRSRGGVRPTPAGEALYRHALNLLRLSDRMEAELSEFGAGVRGHVRVAANTSCVTQFLPEELAAFLKDNPEIRIDLTEGISSAIVQDVADGHLDIGLFSEAVDPGGLETFPYRTDHLMVVMPPGHELDRGRAVAFEEVLDYPVIGLQTGSSLYDRVQAAARDLGAMLDCRLQVASFDGLRGMVESGLGVGFLPEGAVTPFLNDRLTAHPLSDAWAHRRLLLGVREAAALPAVAQKLLMHLTGTGPGATAAQAAAAD
ncbi:MAG TPA: LysR family transcriptional regulator [Rhodospirillaceae bacterium]|nr:LysR family transcriptional regulator [Rhodospirillaceae bacterium]